MDSPCVFKERCLCTATSRVGVKKCCDKMGSKAAPQTLVEAYLRSLKADAPSGAVVALMGMVSGIETESGTSLL